MDTDTVKNIEQSIHKMLLEKTSQVSYNAWLKDLMVVDIKENQIFFSIYSDYKKNIIESNYMPILEDIVGKIVGINIKIVFINLTH